MADYRVTVTMEPWVDQGYVVFPVQIERPDGVGGWTGVQGATSSIRAKVPEVNAALQSGTPLASLGALLVAYAQDDTAVIADALIAPYRQYMPAFPVSVEFEA